MESDGQRKPRKKKYDNDGDKDDENDDIGNSRNNDDNDDEDDVNDNDGIKIMPTLMITDDVRLGEKLHGAPAHCCVPGGRRVCVEGVPHQRQRHQAGCLRVPTLVPGPGVGHLPGNQHS